MENQAKGVLKEGFGRAQDAFGGATGDLPTQVAGKVRQVAGKVQKGYGDAIEGIVDSLNANPLGTLAVVAGASFLLGALWSRRD